jgi:hypothetical protein
MQTFEMIKKAFICGFMASTEGDNGEYYHGKKTSDLLNDEVLNDHNSNFQDLIKSLDLKTNHNTNEVITLVHPTSESINASLGYVQTLQFAISKGSKVIDSESNFRYVNLTINLDDELVNLEYLDGGASKSIPLSNYNYILKKLTVI